MLSERVRQRLEQLNRGPLPEAPLRTAARDPVPAMPLVEQAQCRFAQGIRLDEEHAVANPIAPALPQPELPGQEVATEWGSHWQWRQPLEQVWPASAQYLAATLAAPWQAMDGADPDGENVYERDLMLLRQCFPRQSVYLDLETCGFAGSMVFLIGLVHWHEQQLVLTQLWARNYAEEKAILQSLWSLIYDRELLVTFNGKSFDWPQVHDRSTLHGLGYREPVPSSLVGALPVDLSRQQQTDWPMALAPNDRRPEPRHLDLLHHARRRWKHQLPNCRLQTLERYVCGRRRVGDLPSSEIPLAYHHYVRTGRPEQVEAILHHNALDLVTLLQVALVFLEWLGTS